eukprot:1416415-Amphidinium_carterae.1
MRPEAEGGYGLTDGCRGCEAIRDGGPSVVPSEACRRRVESEMIKIGEVKRIEAARKRIAEASGEGGESKAPRIEPW